MEEQLRITTIIDDLCSFLEGAKDNEADIDYLAEYLSVPSARIETIGKIMQEKGILEVAYPVNVFAKPKVRLVQKQALQPSKEQAFEAALASYAVEADSVKAGVSISEVKSEARPIYYMRFPIIGAYTERFLEHLRDQLARELPVQTEEILDYKKFASLKQRFYNATLAVLHEVFPELPEDKRGTLAGVMLHRMYGLGFLEMLMADDALEEVSVNSSSEPISVFHRKFGWMKTNLVIPTEEEVYNYASQIARKSGREITLLNPILDAALVSGDRVSATLFPVSANGNTITVRKFARNPWTVTQFIDPQLNTLSVEMAAFLWLSVQYEMNVLIAGGTASGKTSTLNTLAALIPASQRTISIEDTLELSLPSYLRWNWLQLRTRGANPEGQGKVGMLELMVSSLRMRPDRIIVGEVRRGREAQVMFEAMHTGHSVYSTLHADSANQVIRRLLEAPIEVPRLEVQALHLIAVQYRDRRKGIRRVSEIVEVTESASREGALELNTLFKWKARQDIFEKVNTSTRVFSELNLHTGMGLDEINEDLKQKESVLKWMVKHGLFSSEQVGGVMKAYYKDSAGIAAAAAQDLEPGEIL